MDPKANPIHVETKPSEILSNNGETGTYDPEAELAPQIHFKTLLVVFAVCSIYVAQLINIVGAGAFSRDIQAVVGHSDNTVWLTASSTIMNVVLGPPTCQLADYWGRKWILVAMTGCGCIGSIIVSRASSIQLVIVGEVIAGISYGAQPLIHAVASEVLPRKWRPHAQAAANAAVASGGILGLLVGGALTKNNPAGFRTYWYIATVIYFLSAALCALFYNPPRRELQDSLKTSEKFKQLDWIGYGLLTSGLVLFCMGLAWSQNPYPWSDPHVLATFIIGVVLSIGLIVYEALFKTDGLFHHGLFSRGRNFPLSLACIAVEGLAFFAANNYFAFEIGALYETDSLIITVRTALIFIVYLVACPVAGLYCSKMKKIRVPSMAAFTFLIIFFILMATLTPSEASGKHVWGYPALLGAGLGLCLCSLVTAAQLSTPPELISIASGLVIAIRSLGASIGLSIYNAIFNQQLSANLAPKIAEAVLPFGLPKASLGPFLTAIASGDTVSLGQIEGVTPTIISAAVVAQKDVYSVAFRNIWITAGSFTVLALIGSSFLVDPKSDFNSHIDAPAETEEELYAKMQS